MQIILLTIVTLASVNAQFNPFGNVQNAVGGLANPVANILAQPPVPLGPAAPIGGAVSGLLRTTTSDLADLSFPNISVPVDFIWDTYKSIYEKDFGVALTDISKGIFTKNVDFVQNHNKLFAGSAAKFTMQLYEYSHLPFDEFLKFRTGAYIDEDETEKYQKEAFGNLDFSEISPLRFKRAASVPDEIDWNKAGHVTPVKDQGKCGSCWAFATTAVLESQYSIKYGKKLNLSEQQLVSCDSRNKGCDGGNPYNALITVFKDKITHAPNYPFVGETEEGCKYDKTSAPTVECKGYDYKRYKIKGDENLLKEIVGTKGPVAATVRVTQSFEFYKSGIFFDDDCEGPMNHAVVITGYGTENGTDYWIIRNSWSDKWGEDGYMRFARNNKNMCGIAYYGTVPKV